MPAEPFVLVIQHHSELGQVIHDVLGTEGYNVIPVRDRYGAIGVLRNQEVDLLVADLPESVIGGTDPLAEISGEFPDLPVVFLENVAPGETPFFGPWTRDGNRVTLRRPFKLDDLISAARELAR